MNTMRGKKAETKFTFQFSRTDPAHLQVVDILNRLERGFKAQYIVDAVMHFINCDGARGRLINEKHIEAVVKRLLRERESGGDVVLNTVSPVVGVGIKNISSQSDDDRVDSVPAHTNGTGTHIVSSSAGKSKTEKPNPVLEPDVADEITYDESTYDEAIETLGEDGFAAIAGALDIFRRK